MLSRSRLLSLRSHRQNAVGALVSWELVLSGGRFRNDQVLRPFPGVGPTPGLDETFHTSTSIYASRDVEFILESDMHKFALSSIAAGILLVAPVMAQTAPTTGSDGRIVVAQREGGGGMKGGGGGGGGAMKGGGGGGGASQGGGGGGAPAMRGPSGSRSFDGAGRSGGDGAGRGLRGRGDADGGRVLRGNRGGRNIDRGPQRTDPGIKRGNRGPGYGYRGGKGHSRDFVRRRGTRYLWGPGLAFYSYGGSYYGDCDWLERRAIATGSAYWWNRYNNCIDW